MHQAGNPYIAAVLNVINFNRAAIDTLRSCRQAHVVPDFVLLSVPTRDDEELTHRQAAVAGVAEASRPAGRKFVTEARAVPPEWLHGRRLSLRDFYGPLFDPATEILLVRDERATAVSIGGWPPYVPAGQDTSPVTVPRRAGDWAFADAFTNPPYGLRGADGRRMKGVATRDLFIATVHHVLRRPPTETPIWGWEGDWCPYFDRGHEWWGAAAWTVRTAPDRIVTIAVSATD